MDTTGLRMAAAFIDRGLLLRPLGNIVYVMPPYVITEREVAWMLEQVAAVLEGGAFDGGAGPGGHRVP